MGQERRSWLERFEAAYPLLIAGMMSAGNVVITLMQTVIISFGLPVIVFALMFVEKVGVEDGALWFMKDAGTASFAAAALVLLNLGAELFIVHTEQEEKYKRPTDIQWSLRLVWQSMRYRLGRGRDWKAKRKSPAQRFISVRWLIGFGIFFLALTGRMTTAIHAVSFDAAGKPVTAGDGIHHLLYESTLADLTQWSMGTMFTMLSVFAVQSLTNYTALRVSEIQKDLKRRLTNEKAATTRQRRRDERERRLSIPVSTQTDKTDTRQSGVGYVRVSSAVEKARQWLIDNPDKVDTPVRELADTIGVGKDSVAKARKELKG